MPQPCFLQVDRAVAETTLGEARRELAACYSLAMQADAAAFGAGAPAFAAAAAQAFGQPEGHCLAAPLSAAMQLFSESPQATTCASLRLLYMPALKGADDECCYCS